MDMMEIVNAVRLLFGILANALKVWEFFSTRLGRLFKNGTGHTPSLGVRPCYKSMGSA